MKKEITASLPKSGRRSGIVRGAMFLAALVLVVAGIAYLLYYFHRRDYLASRNLRIVSAIAARTERNILAHRQFLKNYARPVDSFAELERAKLAVGQLRDQLQNLERLRAESPLIGDWETEIKAVQAGISDREKKVAAIQEKVALDEKRQRDEERLFLFPTFTAIEATNRAPILFNRAVLNAAGGRAEGFAQRPAFVDEVPSLEMGYRSVDSNRAGSETAKAERVAADEIESSAYGRVALTRLLGAARAFDTSSSFETFFIADASGRILTADAGEGAAATLVDLQQVIERRAFGSATPLDVASLTGSTAVRRVTIGGETYRLFTQPHRLWVSWGPVGDAGAPSPSALSEKSEGRPSARESAAPATRPKEPAPLLPLATTSPVSVYEPWIIGGMVPEREFVSRALAVPSSMLLGGLALALLGFLAFPLLRLGLIGDAERIRTADVLLASLCTIAGVAVLTAVLLDGRFYQGVRSRSLDELEDLSAAISANVATELRSARAELHKARRTIGTLCPPEAFSDRRCGDILARGSFDSYPFFESIFVIDKEGHQQRKWSTKRFATPLVDVKNRAYFSELVAGRGWDSPQGPTYVQSIRSLTTGRSEAVVSLSTGRADEPVIAMATELVSLVDPVMPPGFSFAVIEEEGTVLFHHDSQRNLAENFFVEADDDPELKAAVYGRVEQDLDLTYAGTEYRGWVSPIANTPWTLITLRDKAYLRALNVDVVLITAQLIIAYVLVAAVLALLALLPRFRERWLWPHEARRDHYWRIIWIAAPLLASFGMSIYLLRGTSLLRIAAIFPALILLGVATVFRSSRGGPGKTGALLILPLALFAALAVELRTGAIEPDLGSGAAALRFAILILAAAAIVVDLLPWGLAAPRRARCKPLYLAAASLLLVAGASLPAAAFFKAASAVELDAYIKHAQIELARQEWSRSARIARDFHPDFGANREKETLTRRKAQHLDLYYAFFNDTAFIHMDAYPSSSAKPPSIPGQLVPGREANPIRTAALIGDRSHSGFREWRRDRRAVVLKTSLNPAVVPGRREDSIAIRSSAPARLFSRRAGRLAPADTSHVAAMTPATAAAPRNAVATAEESTVRDFFASFLGMSVLLMLPIAAAFLLVRFIAGRLFIPDFLGAEEGDARGVAGCGAHAAPGASSAEKLEAEAASDPLVAAALESAASHAETYDGAIEQLLERVSAHYDTLWNDSTEDEKMVLEHLARDGFVNVKARRAIRRLISRGLIRMCPEYPAPHLMNESFRRFVLDSARRKEVHEIVQQHAPSLWEAVRIPLFVGVAALLVFFFVTQRDVFDATTGLITGLAASLLGIIKIFTTIGNRRTAAGGGEGS